MEADSSRSRVRVRGIYATALTGLLQDAGFEVVDASPAIEGRFEADFDDGHADVTVRMTGDRQGVGITGAPEATASVASELDCVGIDTFSWEGAAPRGALFRGRVGRTNRGGAIVDLGVDREGFLPFGATDDYVDAGDSVLVQVHEPAPPWSRDRPTLGTEIRAFGGIATLVRGVDALVASTPDGGPEHELARTTEMLSPTVPEDWGVRWEYAAEDADMETLETALERAVERATAIETALAEESQETGPVADPGAVAWTWFGRESRFALDDHRAAVVPTLPGHHRIKAGSDSASAAVDFAERLDGTEEAASGQGGDSFPFEAVTDVFGPEKGSRVTIRHGKPEGQCLTLGEGRVTDRSVAKCRITVERTMTTSGTYDALGTDREPGDVATTRFAEGRWWYPTVYRSEDGQVKGTYVNIATPVEIFPRAVRYLDLHVDVIKHTDGTVKVVDEDELQEAVEAGHVPEPVAEKAMDVAERVENAFAGD